MTTHERENNAAPFSTLELREAWGLEGAPCTLSNSHSGTWAHSLTHQLEWRVDPCQHQRLQSRQREMRFTGRLLLPPPPP